MTQGEWAHHWRHPGLAGVDLLRARYVAHSFARHTHDGFVVGVVTSGVEEFAHAGSVERAAAGEMALVNPDTVHTGHAGVREGWTYRVLYPSVETVVDVAAELGMPRGMPSFPLPVVRDDELAARQLRAHHAAEAGDALAASSLLRLLLASLLRRQGTARPRHARPAAAGTSQAGRARDLLLARMADPPTITELAGAVGVSPFALTRSFTAAYGLPPHAYLNQRRVFAARARLDAGVPVARAAAEVGFADQAHLTRHFRRIVGVPPGSYRRARLAA